VNNIRGPSKLFHGFQNASNEEDAPLIVVCEHLVLCIVQDGFALEVFFIIDEVDLHSCRRDGGDFDHERVIGVVNIKVHAGQSDYLMQLVPAFVDFSKSWSENTDLSTFFMHSLWQIPAD
jgi:hypothetical protein